MTFIIIIYAFVHIITDNPLLPELWPLRFGITCVVHKKYFSNIFPNLANIYFVQVINQ